MNDAEEKKKIEVEEEIDSPEAVGAEEAGDSQAGGEGAGAEAEETLAEEEAPLTIEEELEQAKARADENYQNYLRTVAEMDTYKRRVIREKDDLRQYALVGLLESILPVYDNLNLGLMSAEQTSDPKVVVQGIQMVLTQFKGILEENGIAEIEPAKGDAFDHNQHEAVQTQPSEEVEEGSILQLVRRGFSLNGRLVRPATVIVAGSEGE